MAVNRTAWRSAPIGAREQEFNADDAIARLVQRYSLGSAAGKPDEYFKAFLYREDGADAHNRESYRLPIHDVINNKLVLVPHAVYAAAALLSGAHGGLPNIPDKQKDEIRNVISEIYIKLRDTFNDPRIRPPWDRGQPPERRSDANMTIEPLAPGGVVPFTSNEITLMGPSEVNIPFKVFYTDGTNTTSAAMTTTVDIGTFADNPKEPYGDVEYADPGYQEDGKKRYPLDSEEHCRAAWSYINMPKNAEKYTPEQLAEIKGKIKAALKKYGVDVADDEKKSSQDKYAALVAAAAPLAPPKEFFDNPHFKAAAPLTVTEQGRVFGHLALWGTCHTGIGNSCVTAPKSVTNYSYFKSGAVLCADGSELSVGKITLGGGHARPGLGWAPALAHYDESGSVVAVARTGEDRFGIWFSGAIVPGTTEEQIAELRRSPISGDWRRVNGNLELIAALAVNSPGFPVVREENGVQLSLVAAGTFGGPVIVDLDEEASTVASRLAALRHYDQELAKSERIRRIRKMMEE